MPYVVEVGALYEKVFRGGVARVVAVWAHMRPSECCSTCRCRGGSAAEDVEQSALVWFEPLGPVGVVGMAGRVVVNGFPSFYVVSFGDQRSKTRSTGRESDQMLTGFASVN